MLAKTIVSDYVDHYCGVRGTAGRSADLAAISLNKIKD